MQGMGRAIAAQRHRLYDSRTGRVNLVTGRRGDARLTLTRDPLRMLLFVLVIVTISRIQLYYPALATLRPALLLSGLAIMYAFLKPRAFFYTNMFAAWPMRVIGLLFVLACCSVPFGISLGNSALFIVDSYFKTILLAFLLILSVRNVRDLYTYVWAFVISCGILCYFAVFVFSLEPSGGATARLGELYTYDSNDLGVLLVMGLALTLLLLFVDRGAKRWLLMANVVGISVSMGRSGSRGGFLGLIAVALATLIIVRKFSVPKKLGMLTIGAAVLAIGSPRGYWDQMATILAPQQDYNLTSIDGRSALIKRGIGYMKQYPVFGVGIANFPKAECTISPKVKLRPIGEPLQCRVPHNSYVQAGAELGVPGLIAWVSLVLGLIVAPLRLRRRFPRAWLKGSATERFLYSSASLLSVAMCGFAVTSFFVTFAFNDPVYIMAAFFSALYVVSRAYLRTLSPAALTVQSYKAPARRAGWRVLASAQRFFATSAAWRSQPS